MSNLFFFVLDYGLSMKRLADVCEILVDNCHLPEKNSGDEKVIGFGFRLGFGEAAGKNVRRRKFYPRQKIGAQFYSVQILTKTLD